MNPEFSQPRTAAPAPWIHARELADADVPAPLRRWLLWQGLLTEALRAACGQGFRLQVLRQGGTELDEASRALLDVADERALCREIVMGDRRHSYVYARTLVPTATLAAHPWLETLGEAPLGERLQQVDGLSREAFEYAQLAPGDAMLAGLVPASPRMVWARRSVFQLTGGPLCVLEAFLPDIARCRTPGGA